MRLERMRALTISLINGNTVGGGVQLALCTDLRIAQPTPRFSCQRSKWDSYRVWASLELPKHWFGTGKTMGPSILKNHSITGIKMGANQQMSQKI